MQITREQKRAPCRDEQDPKGRCAHQHKSRQHSTPHPCGEIPDCNPNGVMDPPSALHHDDPKISTLVLLFFFVPDTPPHTTKYWTRAPWIRTDAISVPHEGKESCRDESGGPDGSSRHQVVGVRPGLGNVVGIVLSAG